MQNMQNMTCFSWAFVLIQHRNKSTLVLLDPCVCICQDFEQLQQLQNRMLSILSLDSQSEIPGGRINTMSWRLVCCNFFGTNGHEDSHILHQCFVCTIKRMENRQT